MKQLFVLSAAVCCVVSAAAQQKYFEGELIYRVNVKSRLVGLSDKDAHKIVAIGESLSVTLKGGDSHVAAGLSDVWSIGKDKKLYYKFRKIDTLYYQDFTADTSSVLEVVKSDSSFRFGPYGCKLLTIRTGTVTRRFYYSDSLYGDPRYEKDATVGQSNVYSRETGGALFLMNQAQYPYAIVTDSLIRMEKKAVDDHVFDLPKLPRRALAGANFFFAPRFPGNDGAWQKFLETNLDNKLSLKYVKIGKDEQEAADTVKLSFLVGEDGSVSNIQVLNRKEVPSRLADEAVRVMGLSPRWLPATLFGDKVSRPCEQSVIFAVTR